ncbi:MAG: lamin tail domain-containing protein, partial [Bacteroidetes bacterium]|nr:lamin tail domain-containing protein [Bacteroidota bacterium]
MRTNAILNFCGHFFTILVLASFSFVLNAQIVINEGSNKNYLSLTDEDGENSDWIELYNWSTSPVDLHGYSLTDDPSEPMKWTFPHVNLLPGDFAMIFCSSKDRFASPPFTTVINTGSFTPAVGWNTHIFSTPFFWDGVANIIINVCSYSSLGYITNSVFNQTETPFASTIFAFEDGSPAACYNNYGTPVNVR